MTARRIVAGLLQQDRLNFVLTNRIPRRLLTRLVGWLSRIEQPLIRDLSIGIWRLFATIDLADTENRRFRSMHDCFTRALRPGARPIDADPEALVSPCDAIVGACGRIGGTTVVQAKGFPYTLDELLLDPGLADRYRDGSYVTLRLTSGMYHRFHAPQTGKVEKVTYVAGDTWNVNASALRRIDKLFCKNERALIEMRLDGSGYRIVLVPVAAVLVASIRLHCVDVTLHLGRHGPNVIPCAAAVRKGEEMGWFEHGSTIIVIAPSGFELFPAVSAGQHIRMGESLLRMPPS
ncbi:MAG TPA: archaetidylserine decarboxylase, partial [Casimicrobiaceae bacterium]